MKKKTKIFLIVSTIVFVFFVAFFVVFLYFFGEADPKCDGLKEIIVEPGMSTRDIAKLLKKEKLIVDENVFIIYTKLTKNDNIQAASYIINACYTLRTIVKELNNGGTNINQISITFKEGINIRKVAKVIAENTNNTESDVFNLLKDQDYLEKLIEEYWFIDKTILNKNIYYPLEGYLYPDTYFFNSKDVTVKEIFKTMLDQMNKKLTPYKDKIEKSSYSIHQILTIASMAESEGADKEDRKNIAGVFYNRLAINMSLGSCATTYYAFKVDFGQRDLTYKEINTYNPYNTRGPEMTGILPVGPISAPGLTSIDAAINPNKNDYYYFVSDKFFKLYFTKSFSEHEQMIKDLQNKGLWLEW